MPIYKSITAARAFRTSDKRPRPAMIVSNIVIRKPGIANVKRRNQPYHDIRKQQKMTSTAIPQRSFAQVVRSITYRYNRSTRFQTLALECLQQACEQMIVQMLSDCVLLAEHAKRVTIMDRDMRLLVQIMRPPWQYEYNYNIK